MLIRIALAAACLAAPVHTAAAQDPTSSAAQTKVARAAVLAKVVTPDALTLANELGMARQAFLAGGRGDAEGRAFEAEHPGIYDRLWALVEPEFRQSSLESTPRFREQLAKLYVERLTLPEINTVISFFGTPTGQKMIRNMYGGIDAAPLIADALKGERPEISQGTMQAAIDGARNKALAQLDESDHAELIKLGRSISLTKMQGVSAAVQKLTLEFVNEPDPAFDARIEKIIDDAIPRLVQETTAAKR